MRVSCDDILTRLSAYIAGGLSAARRREIDEHLRGCADCRALRDLLATEPAAPPVDLTPEILDRTSGPACASAQERLCDHVDGSLDEVDEALLLAHREGCAPCDALARTLARLSAELPKLARLPLDDRFVDEVLARTSSRRLPAARWTDRITQRWERLLLRPRIAWEMAYVASMLLLLLFGAPSSPLSGVPGEMIELARINPVQELKEPAAQLTAEVGQSLEALGVEAAWRSSGDWVAGKSRQGRARLTELSESTWIKLKELGTLWPDAASQSGQNDNEANRDAASHDASDPDDPDDPNDDDDHDE